MIEASTQFMVGRLSTESGKCNSFNLDGIFGNDRRISRHLTYTAIYSHFFAGRFLKETPPGEDVDYISTWLTFRF